MEASRLLKKDKEVLLSLPTFPLIIKSCNPLSSQGIAFLAHPLVNLTSCSNKSLLIYPFLCFSGGSGGKESAYNARDPGLIPGLRRSPGGGNGYPPWYPGLENSTDKGACQVTERLTLSLIYHFALPEFFSAMKHKGLWN